MCIGGRGPAKPRLSGSWPLGSGGSPSKTRTVLVTMIHSTILYYAMLCYAMLYYTILYYTILYYTILYYTILYYTILYYTNCTILYYAPERAGDPARRVARKKKTVCA